MNADLVSALRSSLANRPRGRRTLELQVIGLVGLALPSWLLPNLPLPKALNASIQQLQQMLPPDTASILAASLCTLLIVWSAWALFSTLAVAAAATYFAWWPLAVCLAGALLAGLVLFHAVHVALQNYRYRRASAKVAHIH